MTYLFAAYTIVWLLIAGYIFFIGRRQKEAIKELKLLQQLEEENK